MRLKYNKQLDEDYNRKSYGASTMTFQQMGVLKNYIA